MKAAIILSLGLLVGTGFAQPNPRYPFPAPSEPFYLYSTGTSMLPAIPNGGWIKVTPISYQNLRAGLTVLYWEPNRGILIHHRLIRKTGNYWRLKGDNNRLPDYWPMSREGFIGVTERVDRVPTGYSRVSFRKYTILVREKK